MRGKGFCRKTMQAYLNLALVVKSREVNLRPTVPQVGPRHRTARRSSPQRKPPRFKDTATSCYLTPRSFYLPKIPQQIASSVSDAAFRSELGLGLRPILDKVRIPHSTAYWWIDRYKEQPPYA